MTIYKVLKYYKKTNDFELLSRLNENNINEIYYKLKRKYLQLKGGTIITSNSNRILINYHGSLDITNEFTIPNNVYLILPHCCGMLNYASIIEKPSKIINKENFINEINNLLSTNINNKGVIKFLSSDIITTEIYEERTYLLFRPGQKLCNINMSYEFDTKIEEGIYADNIKKYFNFNRKIIKESNVNNLQKYITKIIKRIEFNFKKKYFLIIENHFSEIDINNFNLIFKYYGCKYINDNINDEEKYNYLLNINFNEILQYYDNISNKTLLDMFKIEEEKVNNPLKETILLDFIKLLYEWFYTIYFFSVNLTKFEEEIIKDRIKLSEVIEKIINSDININKDYPLIITCSSCQGILQDNACYLPKCLNKINNNIDEKFTYYINNFKYLDKIISYIKNNEYYFPDIIKKIINTYFLKKQNINISIKNNILKSDYENKDIMINILFNFLEEQEYETILLKNRTNNEYTSLLEVSINHVINNIIKNCNDKNINCLILRKLIYNYFNKYTDYMILDNEGFKVSNNEDNSIFNIYDINIIVDIINYYVSIMKKKYIINIDLKKYNKIIPDIEKLINSLIESDSNTKNIIINKAISYIEKKNIDISTIKKMDIYNIIIIASNIFIDELYINNKLLPLPALPEAKKNIIYYVYNKTKNKKLLIDINDIIKIFEIIKIHIDELKKIDKNFISMLYKQNEYNNKFIENETLFINKYENIKNIIINAFLNYYDSLAKYKENYRYKHLINSTNDYTNYDLLFNNIIFSFIKDLIKEFDDNQIMEKLSNELKEIIKKYL